MPRKTTPGLRRRGEVWHIEKVIEGVRVFESTGSGDLAEAERYLIRRAEQIRAERVYGARRRHTLGEAGARYLMEHAHKPGIARQGYALARLVEHFGEDCALSDLHSGATDGYAAARRSAGVTTGTINRELGALRRVLRLAAGQWRDDTGKTWLETMPMLPSVSGTARGPRPISVEEQARLLREMPDYLAELALFVLHTGLRDQEACGLRWEWEYRVAGTEHVVFVIPGAHRKNARDHIVPLNSVARSLVESRRGSDPVFVFGIDGKLHRMNNRAWKSGRARAGLPDVRVHDLRHTFGMRLRAAGVSYEDRQDLLGHYAGRITTHYSRVEIAHLIECVELLARADARPDVALVRAR